MIAPSRASPSRASSAARLAAITLLVATATGQAADPASGPTGGPPPGLSYSGDSLHLVPPPGVTVTEYTIHYTTPGRLTAGDHWGIWAKNWPATVLDIPLGAAQTKAGCETLGPGASCNRPDAVGEQAPGQTLVYRAYALVGGQWSAASPNLTVTRPAP